MTRTSFTVHTPFGPREFDRPPWQYSVRQNGVLELARGGRTEILYGLAGWLLVEERSEQPAVSVSPREQG